MENTIIAKPLTAISSADLLDHYQGHRRLTRRLLEGFPEDRFFDYSIGGMRSVAALAMEQINVSGMGVTGAATRNWNTIAKKINLPPNRKSLICGTKIPG